MAANVITFESQAGSSGPAIAQIVASRLGYTYYDWEIIARAAELAGVSQEAIVEAERWPTFGERLMKALILTAPARRSAFFAPDGDVRAVEFALSRHYTPYLTSVVRDRARAGNCVILGHAAQAILSSGIAFKVLTKGSLEARVDRLGRQQDVCRDVAMARVKAADKEQGEFLKHVHNVNWLDPSLYHLELDTDNLSNAAAAELVLVELGALERVSIGQVR